MAEQLSKDQILEQMRTEHQALLILLAWLVVYGPTVTTIISGRPN